jgi:hypothetical protein
MYESKMDGCIINRRRGKMSSRLIWQGMKVRVTVNGNHHATIEKMGEDSLGHTRWDFYDDQKSCKIAPGYWEALLGMGLALEEARKKIQEPMDAYDEEEDPGADGCV